jgi:hypothetical protein
VTLDETTLASALFDLAATAPEDPGRLTNVHRRARRLNRRHRAVGAGAIAATMAGVFVAADVFVVGSGRGPTTIQPAAGGATPGPSVAPATPPACTETAPGQPPAAPAVPPAIGQQFSGGGMVAATGTAGGVTIAIGGGPLAGSQQFFAVTPATKVFLSSPVPKAPDVASTTAELHVGEGIKFSATRTGATTYVLDEVHAAPVAGSGGSAGSRGSRGSAGADGSVQAKQAAAGATGGTDVSAQAKRAAGQQAAGPPPIGGQFKAGGVALASTANSVTVNVDHGNLTGTITFTLACTLTRSVAGDPVEVAGTRTGTTTYAAQELVVSRPPVTP